MKRFFMFLALLVSNVILNSEWERVCHTDKHSVSRATLEEQDNFTRIAQAKDQDHECDYVLQGLGETAIAFRANMF